MLLSLHADADRTDPRRGRIRADRHATRPSGGVPPQRLHADERHHRGPPGLRRSIDRRSGSRVGVSRCFGPIARSYRSADLDSTSLGGASLWPSCVHVPDHALVRTLRSSSQTERGQQRLTGVGACCDVGDSKNRKGDHRGPHNIHEDVDGAAELEPVHGSLHRHGDFGEGRASEPPHAACSRITGEQHGAAHEGRVLHEEHHHDDGSEYCTSDADVEDDGPEPNAEHGADDTRRTA